MRWYGHERYVIRLEWHRDDGRIALVLEEGMGTNIEVHVLQDDRLPGKGGTYDVEEIEVIPTDLEWVIHYRNRNRYHRPDPEAAGRGRPTPSVGTKPKKQIRNLDGWKIYTRTSGPVRTVFETSLTANDGVDDEKGRIYTRYLFNSDYPQSSKLP